jgi:hypothetical protein
LRVKDELATNVEMKDSELPLDALGISNFCWNEK